MVRNFSHIYKYLEYSHYSTLSVKLLFFYTFFFLFYFFALVAVD